MGLALGRLLPGAQIYERAPFIGGSARGVKHLGFQLDVGLHVLGRPSEPMARFLRSVVGEDLVELPQPARRLMVHEDGRTWDVPLRPSHFPLLPDPALALRIRFGYRYRRLFPIRPVRTYRDLSVNATGDGYYAFLTEKALTKSFGVPPDRLAFIPAPPDEARREPPRKRILGRLRRMRRTPDTFFYVRPSFGSFVDRLAQGLDIRCGAEITRVRVDGARLVALEAAGAGTIPCDDLILAIPGHMALRLFDAPAEVRRSAEAIRHRDLIYTVLFFDQPHVLPPGYGSAVGSEIFGSFYEPKHFVPGRWPPDKTCVGFFISCVRGDATWNSPDDEIIRRVSADFGRYYPGATASAAKVVRIPHFLLVLDPDLELHLRNVHRYLSSFENLHLPGHLMPIRGDRTYAALDEAFRIAAEITGGRAGAGEMRSA
jgi:protoporphyrinogen oxidase